MAWTANQIPNNPTMHKSVEVVALILLVMGNEEVDPDQFDTLFALSNPAAKVLESQDFVGRFNEEANFFGLDQPGGFGMVKNGWFGEFRDTHFSYVTRKGLIDHKEHGWLWAAGIGHPNGGIWLWDYIQEDWIWTRSDVHPFFYSNNNQRWFYYEEGGQPSSRWFYDYVISAWVEVN